MVNGYTNKENYIQSKMRGVPIKDKRISDIIDAISNLHANESESQLPY